jgi:putative zinc finger/helix-turn-helix YgiT family protein
MAISPRKCPKCHERRLNEVTEQYESTREHDGRAYAIAIPDLEMLVCEACGNRIIPEDSDDRLSDALRRVVGVLAPAEIRESRLKLGLTQERMARDLGVAEATLSRWETGAQIQQRAFDKILRAYFGVPELRKFFSGLASLSESSPALPGPTGRAFSADERTQQLG